MMPFLLSSLQTHSCLIHFFLVVCSGHPEDKLSRVRPWESKGFLQSGLIFPSGSAQVSGLSLGTSKTWFTHPPLLPPPTHRPPVPDRSSCTSWQIGHVISKIPASLTCSQHFCQHSIWRSNFTKAGTPSHPYSCVYTRLYRYALQQLVVVESKYVDILKNCTDLPFWSGSFILL